MMHHISITKIPRKAHFQKKKRPILRNIESYLLSSDVFHCVRATRGILSVTDMLLKAKWARG